MDRAERGTKKVGNDQIYREDANHILRHLSCRLKYIILDFEKALRDAEERIDSLKD